MRELATECYFLVACGFEVLPRVAPALFTYRPRMASGPLRIFIARGIGTGGFRARPGLATLSLEPGSPA
jgi:hypothetical protein